MDFHDMGISDIRSEIEKFGTTGELKSVTVRIDSDYAEFLNSLSSVVGMNRQPFMATLIENYAVDAIADYISGYASHLSNFNLKDFFGEISNSEQFEKFYKALEKELAKRKVYAKSFNAYEGKEKQHYFEKYIEPKILQGTLSFSEDGSAILKPETKN